MRALRRKSAPAEAVTLSQIDTRVSSLTRDERNITLTLVRMQPSATAARGRGLVRLLDDLAADLAPDTERPIPVVAQCETCARFYNVAVDLRDANDPVVLGLPSNCRRCGHPLDDYQHIRSLIGAARHYVETFSRGRAS